DDTRRGLTEAFIEGGSRTSGRSNGDEKRPEPRDRPTVSADDDLCRLPGAAVDGLSDDGADARRAVDRSQARAQDVAQRCRGRRGDPRGARGESVPWRGVPQGPSAP